MIKFSKIVKAVTSVVSPKAEVPSKETTKQEPAVKAEEEAETEELVPVKMESKHYVACPHCTKKFEVAYDPTDPTKHGEEESEEEVAEEVAPKKMEESEEEDKKVEEKAEEKVEDKKSEEVEPHKEPDGDEVEPKDDKDEEKKTKKALGSLSDWQEATLGSKKATKENMFHKAVYAAFPIENLK